MVEHEEDSNSRTEIPNVNQDATNENKMPRGYNIVSICNISESHFKTSLLSFQRLISCLEYLEMVGRHCWCEFFLKVNKYYIDREKVLVKKKNREKVTTQRIKQPIKNNKNATFNFHCNFN